MKASHILFLVNKDDSQDVVNQKLEAAKAAEDPRKKGKTLISLPRSSLEEPGARNRAATSASFPRTAWFGFAEAAFNQRSAMLSDPVRTQYGWHIIKVIDRNPAGTLPYDDVKPS